MAIWQTKGITTFYSSGGNLGICFPNKSSDWENTIFLNPTLKYFTRHLTERFIPLEDNNFKYFPNMRSVASCLGKKVRLKVWEIAGSVKCDIKIMFYNLDQRFSLSHSRPRLFCLLLFAGYFVFTLLQVTSWQPGRRGSTNPFTNWGEHKTFLLSCRSAISHCDSNKTPS